DVLAPVREDLPEGVDIAFEQKESVGGGLYYSPGIRRHARHAGRQAIRLGIVFRHALGSEFFSPRLQGEFLARLERGFDVVDESTVMARYAGEIGLSGCRARRGSCGHVGAETFGRGDGVALRGNYG